MNYLVDTGACESLIPGKLINHRGKKGKPLRAANGSQIDTYGRREYTVTTPTATYTWKFLVADVYLPLIGADFLDFFDLLVDVKRKRLVPASDVRLGGISTAAYSGPVVATIYDDIKAEFKEVFSERLKRRPTKGGHGIRHHIKTAGPPVYAKFRRLPPQKLATAKACFQEMEAQGVCQKAPSPWASPLYMVEKKDGTARPCGDYRRLNNITEPDHYPLPNIADITSYLHGAKIFSKLDMLKGYFQVPMNPEDIQKTAITTPFGSYTFNYSCFGLKNAGATFQRLMDNILGDLPFCVCYVDDILIFSTNESEHTQHLKEVLTRLRNNNLVLKESKCIFAKQKIEFLGHIISKNGVSPLPSKVEAITTFPRPAAVKKLQEFLGMVTFYHRFLPGIAKTLAPLNDMLKGKPKELQWSPAADEAFLKAKDALAKATLLAYPSTTAALRLSTDASDVAVGAVLDQIEDGVPKPLGFFSRKLSNAERRYSTFDRELLAVFSAVRHFKHLLQGRQFEVMTDHLPLVHAISKKTDPESNRQQWQLSMIAEYNCTLHHLPGKSNCVADALSRGIIAATDIGLDLNQLERLQKDEEEEARKNTSLSFVRMLTEDKRHSILCDNSTGRLRPWIPRPMRKTAFDIVHNLSHPSRRTTCKLLTQKFVWQSIKKDAQQWAKTCQACQTCKIHRHTESGVGEFPQPRRRFGHIHVDIVGPLPASKTYRYLLTIIDRSTRWPEAIPMQTATTETCVEANRVG